MRNVFLCDAIRTPIGRYGGALSSIRPDDLAAHVLRALIARNGTVDFAQVDDVIMGCANQAGEDNRNVARMALLLAGLPVSISGTTVNRLCASGADAVAIGARAIAAGEADLIIAGGVESMSRAPYVMAKPDQAFSRQAEIFDTTIGWRFANTRMVEACGTDSMPETAENVATEFGISRLRQDIFAEASQAKVAAAQMSGRFDGEIVPVEVDLGRGKSLTVKADEHPRKTDLATLGKLRPIVCADGTITAGNASGVNDGAAAMILASEQAVATYGLTPRARICRTVTVGVAPRIMGIGPAPAIQKLLAAEGISLDAIDILEINEAFAAQVLAVLQHLKIADDDLRVNPNGGAIALGHPLGMSGARLIQTAAIQLQQTGARYAVVSMCVGVGQGLATLLERV